MKYSLTLAALVAAATAYPSMQEFEAEVVRRQNQGGGGLWGDLESSGPKSEAGEAIIGILSGSESGLSADGYEPPEMDSPECADDPCCVWKYLAEEMIGLMEGGSGCNDFARGAIRLGFHDAGTWEKGNTGGGADASIILGGELGRSENSGLSAHAGRIQGLHSKYSKTFKISLADTIQLGAKVAVMACKGPRIRYFIGRPDSSDPAPQGLLPPPTLTAAQSMDLFGRKTVSPKGLVALLGAHTCSNSHGQQVLPQDKSPGVWDTAYFSEALRSNASTGVVRFLADVNLAHDSTTGEFFEEFSNNHGSWDAAYASEYIRMSLMGVMRMNDLTECTKAMPRGNKNNDDKPKTSTTSAKPTSTKESEDKPTTSAHKTKDSETYKVTTTSYEDAAYTPPPPASAPKEDKEDKSAPVASGAGRFAASLLLAVAGGAFALL